MPEEVCADVARTLLKHLMVASGFDKDPVPVVRAFKAFRAVNKTFRDAFEEDRLGCTILCRYVTWLHNGTVRRRQGVERFLKMRSRAEPDRRRSTTARRATEWIFELLRSLENDLRNYKRFIHTLQFVMDGNVLRDLAVYHYAMLPLNHPESVSRDHGGLPRGSYKLSASLDPLKHAPYGTIAWAEDLVFAGLPITTEDRLKLARKAVNALFQIEREEESPAARRHDRWTPENLKLEWTRALEEQLGGMELNLI
jgi:hypothetical protein